MFLTVGERVKVSRYL